MKRRNFPALLLVSLALLTGCHPRQVLKTEPPAPLLPTAPAAPVADTLPAFDPTVYVGMSPRCQNTRVPVIMYHDVVEKRGPGSVWFDCTTEEFEKQMQWLVDQGYQPITLETLHKHLTRGETVPNGAVVITFDDNYQGFYDNAYPILKKLSFPSAIFVHTNFVGDKTGTHPKMDWDTLRALDTEGLVTIGSHTMSHPDDMRTLPADQQETELTGAKEALERELNHAVPYLAYPNGNADATTVAAAQRAGYTMAFTIENQLAEESPDILLVGRYIETHWDKAWKAHDDAIENGPAAVVELPLTPGPIRLGVGKYGGTKLGIIHGGMPTTRRGVTRQSVGEFVQEAGGVAGINGTFFANAELRGTDNAMIGPCLTESDPTFLPDTDPTRLPRLINRPLIVWGPTRIAVVPFQPGYMNAPDALHTLMPDMTNAFLAGAWIVHDGKARTPEQMTTYGARDLMDPRRRAFFGLTPNGEILLGASLEVITTAQLARAAEAVGVQEAVLLDSGFSTSLVYNGKIIVTGHTARNLPSRPVPHAIVLTGTLEPPTDPATLATFTEADPAVGKVSAAKAMADTGPDAAPARSRKRRVRH